MLSKNLSSLLSEYYHQASLNEFPAFLDSDTRSTPLNSAPYITTLSHFCHSYTEPPRSLLAMHLQACIPELATEGVVVDVALAGGSFLTAKATPGDLDAVLFYSIPAQDITLDLSDWQSRQKLKGLDIRLVPIDTQPILTLKMAMFFAILYTHKKYKENITPGLVLIDCTH